MSSESHKRRMRKDSPRRAYRWDELPDELAELIGSELERLSRGEGYDDPIVPEPKKVAERSND